MSAEPAPDHILSNFEMLALKYARHFRVDLRRAAACARRGEEAAYLVHVETAVRSLREALYYARLEQDSREFWARLGTYKF